MSRQKPKNILSKSKIQHFIRRYKDTDPDIVILADMAEQYRSAVVREIKENRKKPAVSLECVRCGRCCLKYGNTLQASDEDVARWKKEGREDILAWVGPFGDLWINNSSHKEASRCPWLRKLPGKKQYLCRIHETKPEICATYPVTRKQALGDGCRSLSSELSRLLGNLG